MFNIGFSEAFVIFIVALIVLGPERLPEIGRFLGKLSLELRKSVEEIKEELGLNEIEKDVEEIKKEITSVENEKFFLSEKETDKTSKEEAKIMKEDSDFQDKASQKEEFKKNT